MGCPLLETLDGRALLSSTLVGTELRVVGSSKADVITIFVDPGDQRKIDVTINKTTQPFTIASVNTIRVDAGAGDDQIVINQGKFAIKIPTTIYARAGNDSVVGG